jgi:hypothetical protein
MPTESGRIGNASKPTTCHMNLVRAPDLRVVDPKTILIEQRNPRKGRVRRKRNHPPDRKGGAVSRRKSGASGSMLLKVSSGSPIGAVGVSVAVDQVVGCEQRQLLPIIARQLNRIASQRSTF